MNQLIKIEVKNDRQLVSARELYKCLDLSKRFSRWVEQNFSEFSEGTDYTSVPSGTVVGNGAIKPLTDYAITVGMAKELCMLSKTENGRKFRKYFIEVERKWNNPQEVVKRAYAILQDENMQLKIENKDLTTKNVIAEQRVNELEPKATYYDTILANPSLVNITVIAKDYDMSGAAMNHKLHVLGVQYKQGNMWLLYSKYARLGWTHSDTYTVSKKDGTNKVVMNTKWTQKGRLGVYEMLKQAKVLPLIEQEQLL